MPSGGRHLNTTTTRHRTFSPWFFSSNQRMGVSKVLPQSRHPVSCPAKGSCTGGTPTECVFLNLMCPLYMLRNKVFYGGRRANSASIFLERGTQLQEDIRRHRYPLTCKELLCPLTSFAFNPARCPQYIHSPHWETWWGRLFSRRQPDHETG